MKAGWLVHPRNLVVYAVLATAAVLVFRLGLTPWIVGAILVPVLVVYYFVLPAIAVRRIPAFDAQLRRGLVSGDPDRLLALYKSQLLLRAFAPPGLMKHRLGQIHSARRVWPLAFQCYYEALRSGRVRDDFPLLLGYAESGFHAGEDATVGPVLARLRKDPRAMASVAFMQVHVMIASGAKPDAIRPLLAEWSRRTASDADAALVALAEAELLGLEGRRSAALEKLSSIDLDGLPDAIRPLAALLEAKIAHVEGQTSRARKLFNQVKKQAASGRALLELREFLEE